MKYILIRLSKYSWYYRKIPITFPGIIYVQKPFLVGLYLRGLIPEKEFCLSKMLGLCVEGILHLKNFR